MAWILVAMLIPHTQNQPYILLNPPSWSMPGARVRVENRGLAEPLSITSWVIDAIIDQWPQHQQHAQRRNRQPRGRHAPSPQIVPEDDSDSQRNHDRCEA